MDEELFDEIFVSSNFTTVFCTQHDLDSYLNYLIISQMPKGMCIVFTKRKLQKKHTKREIISATPDQLKEMIGSLVH